MLIIGYFHLVVPEHNAGSETTVFAALRAMAARGHQVRIICDRSIYAPYTAVTLPSGAVCALRKPDVHASATEQHVTKAAMVHPRFDECKLSDEDYGQIYEWAIGAGVIDGIDVVRPPRRGVQSWLEHFCKDADLLVTHLDLTREAMQLALDIKRPLAHFVHNSFQLKHHHVNTLKCQLAIFNSHWVAENENWPGPQIVIHPVVEPKHYRCERGDAVTLVNPTPGKGAATFYQLARLMPDRQFITVAGAYGTQIHCPAPTPGEKQARVRHDFFREGARYGALYKADCEGLPNVTHLNHTPDIREVFRRSHVLLMPSDYESYGRVGIEAACAGIPTIAHPTEGLKEAFGDAAIFCDRDDTSAWFVEVDRLFSDEVYYRKRSDRALGLANSLSPEAEFDRLEGAFVETVARWHESHGGNMAKMWATDRRLYLTADKRITDKRSEGASLYRGVGGQIPLDTAQALGFLAPEEPIEEPEPLARSVTPDIDTKALSEPSENKAIESPEETKKRGRKKKEAA